MMKIKKPLITRIAGNGLKPFHTLIAIVFIFTGTCYSADGLLKLRPALQFSKTGKELIEENPEPADSGARLPQGQPATLGGAGDTAGATSLGVDDLRRIRDEKQAKIILLSGFNGGGKTTISRYLAGLRYPVIEGDKVLFAPSKALQDKFKAQYGDEVIKNGRLNISIVFARPSPSVSVIGIAKPDIIKYVSEEINNALLGGLRLFSLMPPIFMTLS